MTPVGVVGSSARAAVHSLARAGLSPSLAACRGEAPLHGRSMWAIDQFADRDLKRVAPCAVCPSDRYPAAIPELAKQFPPGPVLYTGGLENHPHVLRELAAERELWGNSADVVERVRDPFTLFPALTACGFVVPRLLPQGEPCPSEGRWLRKPLRSGGGLGIRFAHPGEPASPHHYFQEFIDGVPMSAVYCGTALLGVTEQLIGEPWLHAKGFAYCGNVGPVGGIELPTFPMPLRGVWGLDFVLRAGTAFVVEVNPRYTAAVEVLEFATGVAAFRVEPNPPSPFPGREGGGAPSNEPGRPLGGGTSHPACERHGSALQAPPPSLPGKGDGGLGSSLGKAVYYAPSSFRFPRSGPWDADLAGEFDPWRLPGFADIPEPGSEIEAGHPVLTFFATGSTPAEVRERLQSRAAELDTLFRERTP